MEVSYTYDPRDGREGMYMAVAPRREWEDLLDNLDGVGHSKAAMNLIEQLKSWGIEGK